MRIWVIQLGEPLPMDGPVRLYRTGVLATMLAERGHNVTWWAATFDHTHKKQRSTKDYSVTVGANYRIELLYAKGYQKNVSLGRIRYHLQMARKLAAYIQNRTPPDIILSSLPTPELSKVAIDYAKKYDVPIIIDIRDLWPDIFINVVPFSIRWLASLALLPAFQVNRYIFRKATGIVAISNKYLEWGLTYAQRGQQQTDKVFSLGYERTDLSGEEIFIAKQNLIKSGADPSRIICCFFGVFGRSYDLETVVETARLLQQEGKNDIQFVLCGEGEKLEKLKYASQGLNNVIFPGWVSRSTIAALMSISAIGLAPYVKNAAQSLPNKPFEYFSGGLPVVSSLRGELETLLDKYDCGITYEAGNARDLSNTLLHLCSDSQKRQQMKKNSAQLFESRFSVDCIYPSMIDYLEQVANGELGR